MATPEGKVKLIIDVPVDLKLQFKVHCTANGLYMTDVIEQLLKEYLEQKTVKSS